MSNTPKSLMLICVSFLSLALTNGSFADDRVETYITACMAQDKERRNKEDVSELTRNTIEELNEMAGEEAYGVDDRPYDPTRARAECECRVKSFDDGMSAEAYEYAMLAPIMSNDDIKAEMGIDDERFLDIMIEASSYEFAALMNCDL